MELPEILKVAAFAARKHRTQRRKDRAASPYINHPLAVAETLTRHGVTDPILIQAALVMEAADDKSLPKRERKRRREYLEWTRGVVEGCRGVNEALERRFDEVTRRGLSRLEQERRP